MGFAGAANASATIDLIWAGSGTATTSILATSSDITLQVILTAGPAGSSGAGLSIDYSTVIGKLGVIGYMATTGSAFPISFSPPVDTGSRVENINTVALLISGIGTGLQDGESASLGTVTFHTDVLVAETFTITSDVNGGSDSILDFDNNVILDATFNSAVLMNVPEPGALSMLILGLGGLSLVGRGRRS
jgi:hypothetical protein